MAFHPIIETGRSQVDRFFARTLRSHLGFSARKNRRRCALFLPIGDTPNPRRFTPWVNWGLIALNVLVYLVVTLPLGSQPVDAGDPTLREYLRVMTPNLPSQASLRQVLAHLSAYDLFVFQHGYKPGAPSFSDLAGSMFLHGSFAHLAGNMLFLWIYGDNVEHRLGRVGYLLVYLGSGAAATLTFALFAPASMVPLVGASGAISGALGLYFVLFPRNSIKVAVLLFPFFFEVLLIPARWVLGIYVLIDNLLPFFIGGSTNVAHGAHLGGFLAGLLVAKVGEHFSWEAPWKTRFLRGRARAGAAAQPNSSTLEGFRSALANDDRSKVLSEAEQLSTERLKSLSPDETIQLADHMTQAERESSAARLLRSAVGQHRGRDADAEARLYLALGLLRLRQGQTTSAYQHLLEALDRSPSPDTENRIRYALSGIDVHRRPQVS
jgi:membrane associated rhomboid family serine protease